MALAEPLKDTAKPFFITLKIALVIAWNLRPPSWLMIVWAICWSVIAVSPISA
jgi:hypothetical protein